MSTIQLTDGDLRLLRVLHAVLEEGEVYRAAERLSVTPSAVSHSLRALRERFNDPLLVRSKGRLQATPLALALQTPLRVALAQLADVLARELEFDPGRSRRTFSLATPDYPLFTALPSLVGALGQAAPYVDIRLLPLQADLPERLAGGHLDAVLAGAEVETALALDREMMRSLIISEGFACVMRRGHPASGGSELSFDDYLSYPHVMVSTAGGDRGIVDEALAQSDRRRRVALTVPSFMTAAWFTSTTDLIATLPETIARDASRYVDVVTFAPPLPLPTSTAYLWWHPRMQHDAGHAWWRKTLLDAFAAHRT
jgi:DNA-binding transcriptional LysR family regulator